MSATLPDFEQVCQDMLARAGSLTPGARQCLTEDLRLRFNYPGQYVAWVDHYDLVDNAYQLTRRVLAHSSTPEGIQDAVDMCPEEELANLVVDFVDPLEDDLDLPHEIEDR